MKNIILIALTLTMFSCKKEQALELIKNVLSFEITSEQPYSLEVYAGDKQKTSCNTFLLTEFSTVEYAVRIDNQQGSDVTVKFFLDGKTVYNQSFENVIDLCGGEFDLEINK